MARMALRRVILSYIGPTASGLEEEAEVKVFRNVRPLFTSKSSPIACTTASACPTYLVTVALSKALPATHVTCESSSSSGFGHSPRRESDVTVKAPERTAYLHTCRPTNPFPPMTSSLRLPPPSCMEGALQRAGTRIADALANTHRATRNREPILRVMLQTRESCELPSTDRAR